MESALNKLIVIGVYSAGGPENSNSGYTPFVIWRDLVTGFVFAWYLLIAPLWGKIGFGLGASCYTMGRVCDRHISLAGMGRQT